MVVSTNQPVIDIANFSPMPVQVSHVLVCFPACIIVVFFPCMWSCLDLFARVLSCWHSFHTLCLHPFLQNVFAMQTIRTYSSSKNPSFDWNLGCYTLLQLSNMLPFYSLKSLVSKCLLIGSDWNMAGAPHSPEAMHMTFPKGRAHCSARAAKAVA